jgi:hypothetical protein
LGNVNLTTKVKDSDHRLKQVYFIAIGNKKSRVTISLFQEEEEEDEVYGRALNLSSSSSSPRQSSDQSIFRSFVLLSTPPPRKKKTKFLKPPQGRQMKRKCFVPNS